MPGLQQPRTAGSRRRRCAFCGYAIPASVSAVRRAGTQFCSRACRRASADDERPFADAHDVKRRPVDVPALRPALPEGVPANAAILLAGEEGAHREGLLLEWIWRSLQRGRTAVVAAVDNPPAVLVESFLARGWNVLPFVDRGQLAFLDLFTGRLSDEAAFDRHADRWNRFLRERFGDGFHRVRDPSDLREVSNQVQGCLDDLEATDDGILAFDTLTELASFVQDAQAANFLKEIRAIVAKSRFVPILAGGSVEREDDSYPTEFPHDHEFLFDGIVDLQLDDDLVPGRRIRRLSVRKMDDVGVVSDWFSFEYVPGVGHATVEPAASVPRGAGGARHGSGDGVQTDSDGGPRHATSGGVQ